MPQFKVQNRQFTAIPRTLIFVLMEGRYAIGESPCPKQLGGYATDVCEGFIMNLKYPVVEDFKKVVWVQALVWRETGQGVNTGHVIGG